MADVNSSLVNWSTTRASNGPAGSAVAGAGIDDNLREIQGVVRGWFAYKGADIAVASTMNLGAVEGSTHTTTGTGTVTSFGTVSAGIRKRLLIGGATTTVTHNATSMICPGGASLSLVAGDVLDAESLGGGNWQITGFVRASGKPIASNLASEITSSATGRVSAVTVNSAISQLESVAGPGFTWITVSGTNTLSGTGNALLVTSLSNGEIVRFAAANTNTGPVTLNVNGTGVKDVTKNGTLALAAGDLVAGSVYALHYDGTRFQVLNPGVPSISGLATTGNVSVGGTLAVTSTGTFGGNVSIPNASAYRIKDSAATDRSVLTLTGADILEVGGGAGGVSVKVNNGATTALQVSNTGKINSGALVATTSEVSSAASNVFVTPSVMSSHKGTAKAWVLFDGVPATPTIIAAHNINSIAKVGTGDYMLNFTASMTDDGYTVFAAGRGLYVINMKDGGTKTTSQFEIVGSGESGGVWSVADQQRISVVVYGN